jgi:photosystem II stability/assembly factor-like uncharacterized protein
VVLLQPLEPNEIGRAMAAGICPARMNITDERHEFADVGEEGGFELESATTGAASILWKEHATGSQWTMIRFPVGGSGGLPRWQPDPA